MSTQPLPVHEESVLSPVLEETDREESAHQSPAHYPPIVLSDNLVGETAEVPPVQHESMVINSPSPLNFMENQEMPKLNLNQQLNLVADAPQSALHEFVELDEQEYDPDREDALVVLEVFAKNLSLLFVLLFPVFSTHQR